MTFANRVGVERRCCNPLCTNHWGVY